MQKTLRGMQDKRADGDRGFTLIELLVVVVIIGVLVAIAIPVYLNYRKGAANKSAASDVRAAVSAVEQFYTENGNVYPDDVAETAEGDSMTFTAPAGGVDQTATVSPGNQLQFNRYDTAAGNDAFKICGISTDGGQVYFYNSASGGSVKKSASTTLAACVGATGE